MSQEQPLPTGGQDKIDLAVQVASIAAQVSAVMQSDDAERRSELEKRLSLAQTKLSEQQSPEGLIPFIEVMRAVLMGRDASELAEELPRSYRAVYEQLIDEVESEEEGQLTVREVMQEVSRNALQVLKRGTVDQRRLMANTLLQMAQEAERRPDLEPMIDFITAVRLLLLEQDPSPSVAKLIGPFREQWERILQGLEE
jgi:hypothetical protein